MDTRTFDNLARRLITRRSMLRGFIGGGVAIAATKAVPALARDPDEAPVPEMNLIPAQDPLNFCPSAVISSSFTDATVAVVRDDDMRVAVNGVTVYHGNPGTVGLAEVLTLGPVTNGDRLSVRATHNRAFGAFQQLSSLHLHCLDNGRHQTLDAAGYPTGSGRDFGEIGLDDAEWVFYDQEFTVELADALPIDRRPGQGLLP